MANPEHLAKLKQGPQAWNWWLTEPHVRAAFGADISAEELAPPVPDLSGADLTGVDLSGTFLERANLSGADLQDVNFTGTDLLDASLREANLKNVDLANIKGGLRTEQLAGSDLTGAKLPDQLKKLYDSLDNVKGISESARKIFLAVLAACLYCWLTIATTTDVNLITNRASSPLPIIQTAIPIVG